MAEAGSTSQPEESKVPNKDQDVKVDSLFDSFKSQVHVANLPIGLKVQDHLRLHPSGDYASVSCASGLIKNLTDVRAELNKQVEAIDNLLPLLRALQTVKAFSKASGLLVMILEKEPTDTDEPHSIPNLIESVQEYLKRDKDMSANTSDTDSADFLDMIEEEEENKTGDS